MGSIKMTQNSERSEQVEGTEVDEESVTGEETAVLMIDELKEEEINDPLLEKFSEWPWWKTPTVRYNQVPDTAWILR
jgi:hypothetical protein